MAKRLPQNWYVRRGKQLLGPYPAGLVSRYVLIGRILDSDSVSPDKDSWTAIANIPELFPEVLRLALENPDDDEIQARLEAARRWADERDLSSAVPPDGRDRRKLETVSVTGNHVSRDISSDVLSKISTFWQYSLIVVVLFFIMIIPFLMPSKKESAYAQCNDTPAPGVNWSNCLLQGGQFANADLENAMMRNANLSGANLRAANLQMTDLAYTNLSIANMRGANLSEANLIGADLRGANLTNTRLENADLSYAILTSADLEGAVLTGAKLDYAKWTDELFCMPGSVGECRMARQTVQ